MSCPRRWAAQRQAEAYAVRRGGAPRGGARRAVAHPARWIALAAGLSFGCFSERVTAPANDLCDGGAAPCAVQATDNVFNPATRRVSVGSVVRWTNEGASPHTVTSEGWDSGTLMSGQVFERSFPAAGTFRYECIFHSGMEGAIVVE